MPPATFIRLRTQYTVMGGRLAPAQMQALEAAIDVRALAVRLDREDVLLLREFYATGRPCPDDTAPHVLRVLTDRVHHQRGPLARLSYGAIRCRLENLVALGLVGHIPKTNPAVYYPLDWAIEPARRIMLLVAADFVGVLNGVEAKQP